MRGEYDVAITLGAFALVLALIGVAIYLIVRK